MSDEQLETAQAVHYLGPRIEKVLEFMNVSLNEMMAAADEKMPNAGSVVIQSDRFEGRFISRINNRPRGDILAMRINKRWI